MRESLTAHSQEEKRFHSAWVENCVIPLASGMLQGLTPWKNLACWVQRSYSGWIILLSLLCILVAAIGTKMCVGFGSSKAGFVWGILVKTALLSLKESFFSFPKNSLSGQTSSLGNVSLRGENIRKITSNRVQGDTRNPLPLRVACSSTS